MGFSDSMKTMCEDLTQSRSDREKVMAELLGGFSHDRVERKQGLKRVFGDVHVMIKHYHTARGKMGQELRQMLEETVTNNRKFVQRFLKEFMSQHKAMSGKQAEELKSFCNGIRREVGQMRKGFQQTQKATRADFQKAHEIWMGFAGKMRAAKATTRPGRMGPQARIMAALKGSPEGMTPKELSYAIGTPEKSLNRFLKRMRREGDIRKKKSTFFAR